MPDQAYFVDVAETYAENGQGTSVCVRNGPGPIDLRPRAGFSEARLKPVSIAFWKAKTPV